MSLLPMGNVVFPMGGVSGKATLDSRDAFSSSVGNRGNTAVRLKQPSIEH